MRSSADRTYMDAPPQPLTSSSANTTGGGGSAMTSSAYDELFRRMHDLEQKLQYIERREQDATRHTATQLNAIEDACSSSNGAVANLEVKIAKDLQRIEEQLTREVQNEVRARSDGEARLRKLIEDEAMSIRTTLSSQEQMRAASVQQWLAQSTEQITQSKRKADASFDALQSQLDQATAACSAEASAVEELLLRHQRKREESEMQLLRVLEDSCVQLHQEIVQERLERVESHKKLERLLLETLNRQWTRT